MSNNLLIFSAATVALIPWSPILFLVWLRYKEVYADRARFESYDLARYFIGTFRDEGFLDEEIIKILNCKRKSEYYGIEDDKIDRAAASRALEILEIRSAA